jgi:hypothetical protein
MRARRTGLVAGWRLRWYNLYLYAEEGLLQMHFSLKDSILLWYSRLLVSQGVISRNYDDSQYDGFDS